MEGAWMSHGLDREQNVTNLSHGLDRKVIYPSQRIGLARIENSSLSAPPTVLFNICRGIESAFPYKEVF